MQGETATEQQAREGRSQCTILSPLNCTRGWGSRVEVESVDCWKSRREREAQTDAHTQKNGTAGMLSERSRREGGGEEGNERAWRRRRRCVELGSGGLRLHTAVGAVHSALLVLLLPAHDSQTRCNRPLLQRILSLADLTTPEYGMVETGRLRGRRDAIQAKVGGRDQDNNNTRIPTKLILQLQESCVCSY